MQNKLIIKWVYWPTLNQEIEEYRSVFSGTVLNAGCGNRKITLPRSTKIINMDIYPFPVVDVVGDLEKIPFKNKYFDGVVSVAVLEHCKKPWKIIFEISRVTKINGYFLCVVPFAQPIHKVPSDYYRFTFDGIKSLLEDNGFDIVNVKNTHSFFHIIGWYIEEIVVKLPALLQILLYPVAKFFYILTKYVKFNVGNMPCVITILAKKI